MERYRIGQDGIVYFVTFTVVQWLPVFSHPVAVETEWFWRQKFDYLHDNPCRKGLVRRAVDWRYSLAGFWLSDVPLANDVELSPSDC